MKKIKLFYKIKNMTDLSNKFINNIILTQVSTQLKTNELIILGNLTVDW